MTTRQDLITECNRLLKVVVNEICSAAQLLPVSATQSSPEFAWGRKTKANGRDNLTQRGSHGTACCLIAVSRYVREILSSSSPADTRYSKFINGGYAWLDQHFKSKTDDGEKTAKLAEFAEATVVSRAFLGYVYDPVPIERLASARTENGWPNSTLMQPSATPEELPSLFAMRAFAQGHKVSQQSLEKYNDQTAQTLQWIRSRVWTNENQLAIRSEERDASRALLITIEAQLPDRYRNTSQPDIERNARFADDYRAQQSSLTASTNFEYNYVGADNQHDSAYCELPSALVAWRACVLLAHHVGPIKRLDMPSIKKLFEDVERSLEDVALSTHHAAELLHLLIDMRNLLASTAPLEEEADSVATASTQRIQTTTTNSLSNITRRNSILLGATASGFVAIAAYKWLFAGPRVDARRLTRGSHWFSIVSPGNKSAGTIIFVHGVDSNSEAFRSESQREWQQIVRDDYLRIGRFNIFMIEHDAKLASGNFDIEQAARSVMTAIKIPTSTSPQEGGRAPIDDDRLIFVCHSLGGVIVRQVLVTERAAFTNKRIGLFLVASPSSGSQYADFLSNIVIPSGVGETADQLRAKSAYLGALNDGFKALLQEDSSVRGFALNGQELFENELISGMKTNDSSLIVPALTEVFFPPKTVVPGVTHKTIAKPENSDSQTHKYLVQFILKYFPSAQKDSANKSS